MILVSLLKCQLAQVFDLFLETFQENCCEGNSDFGSDYPYGYEQYGEAESGTPLIPLPPGTPPYGDISESLVKRLKKLANIKKKK